MATCCQLSSLWLSSLLIQFWWWLMAPLIHCLCCDRHNIMVLFADHSWSCIFVNSVLKKILVIFNMSPLHIAMQRSHRETLLLYPPHHRWASVLLREAEAPRRMCLDQMFIKFPHAGNMPRISLQWFFLAMLPCYSSSFPLLHPSNLISLSWDPRNMARGLGFLVVWGFSPFLDCFLLILTFSSQFFPFHRLFWAVHNQQVSLVKPFLMHFHPLPLYH